MRAGALKQRAEILRPVTDVGPYGDERQTWRRVRVVRAERAKISAFRTDEAGEHFPDFRTEFNIRDAHPVEANWRLRQLGGELYTVLAVVPNPDRGFNRVICEKVNE